MRQLKLIDLIQFSLSGYMDYKFAFIFLFQL